MKTKIQSSILAASSRRFPLFAFIPPHSVLLLLAAVFLLLGQGSNAWAANYYWDMNGTTLGSATGSALATGTWNSTNTNWTTNVSGTTATVAWVADSDAFFSAGTDATGSFVIFTGSGVNLSANSLTFEEGTVSIGGASNNNLTLTGSGNITVNSGAFAEIGNGTTMNLSGTAGITKLGAGTLSIKPFDGMTFTGGVRVNAGKLLVDYSSFSSTPINIIPSSNVLSLGGGTLELKQKNNTATTGTFASSTIAAGASSVIATSQGGTNALVVNLQALTRNAGGVVDFTNPTGTLSGSNSIQTSTGVSSTILTDSGVAYATVGGSDWAAKDSTNAWIVGLSSIGGGYTNSTTTVLSGNADVASGIDTTLSSDASITTLRFNQAEARTITLNPGVTLTTGGILVTSTVGNNLSTITSGTLRSAATVANKDLVIINNDPSNFLTIGSVIADATAGATGLTKSGAGTVVLTGSNAYTGGGSVFAGTLVFGNSNAKPATGTVTVANTNAATIGLGVGSSPTYFTATDVDALLSGTMTNVSNPGASIVGIDTSAGDFNYASDTGTNTRGIAKLGANTLTMSGSNTFNQLILVRAGTLKAGSSTAFNNTGPLTLVNASGAAFDLNGFNASFTNVTTGTTGNTITTTGAGSGTDTLTISNFSASMGALFTDGTARKLALNLTGGNTNTPLTNNQNTFSGGLYLGTALRLQPTADSVGTQGNITSSRWGKGTITIGGSAVSGSGAQIYFNAANTTILNDIIVDTNSGNGSRSGSVRVSSTNNVIAGNINANQAAATFSADATASLTLTGRITGTNGLTANISSGSTPWTLTLNNLTGSPSDYQGTTTIGSAPTTLKLGAADQIPNGTGKGNVSVTGTFDLNGYNETINGLSGAGTVNNVVATGSSSNTLTLGDGDATASFTGRILNTSGTLGVTKIGTGTQTLSGSNTYTGPTSINGGILKAANANVLATTGTITVSNAGSTLAVNYGGASDFTEAQVVTLLAKTSFASSATAFGLDTTNASGTYNGVLSMPAGFTKLGSNTLTLTATNTYTGATTISAGTLSISTDNNIVGTASALVFDGGTLQVTGTSLTSLNPGRTTTFNSGKAVGFDIADSTNNFTVSQAINSGTGALSKSGSGVLTLTGSSTFTGNTTINGGKIILANADAIGAAGQKVRINTGGTLEYATNGPANSYILDMGSGNSGTIILNHVNGGVGLSQPMGYSTLGNSTLNLETGANVTTGTANLAFSGIILSAGAAGTLSLNPNTATILVSGSIYSSTNFAKTLGLGGTTAGNEISGEIANVTNTVSVLKSGSSTWTLSGPNTYTGTTTVREGTLTLSGPRTGSSGAITVSDTNGFSAVLNIQDGSFNLGANNFNVGFNATSAATGTVNQSGGTVSFTSGNALLVGQNTVANQGIYNLSGGSITTFASTSRGIMLGVNTGAYGGTFNLSGSGVLNMTAASGGGGDATLQIGRYDPTANGTTNLFNQTGGTANVGYLSIGGAGTTGTGINSTLTLTGGTFSANQFPRLAAGNDNTAVINIGGSADVTLPAFPITRGSNSTVTVYIDGGTLRPKATSPAYMGGLTNAYIKAGGLNLDLSTNDITISQNLLTDGTSTGGGLTKAGSGKLTLAGQSTYTGATTINDGTLAITGSGSINSTSGIAVNNSSLTKLVQNSSVAISVPVAINVGTLTGNGSIGTVTVADSGYNYVSNNDGAAGASLTIGSLTFNGQATVDLYSNSTTAPLITTSLASNAAGTVTINANAAAWLNDTNYDLISYTGTIGGGGLSQFALGTVTGLSSRQSYTFGNSATAITLAISGADLIWTGSQSSAWTTGAVGGAKNWVLSGTAGTPDEFLASDNVVFTGSAVNYTVDITDGNVNPNLTTFTGGSNYLLQSGSGYGISNGSLVKSGAGTLTITNTNSYMGGTTLDGGTINVNNAAALGDSSGALTFSGSGGTIQLGATISSNRNYVMNAAGTLDTNGYDLAHSGVISGTAGLAKTGAGTLTLAGSSTFGGAFTISQGTVIAQNNLAFGGTTNGVTVSPGTTLDLGGSMNSDSLNLGAEVFTVSGTGVGGLGAIVNSGSNQQINAIAKIVLAGPTTFGGTKRWDMRNNSPSLDFGGFTLTKTGSNVIALVGVTGTNAGNIDIQQGTFGVQTSSNLGGSSANAITVRSGATLEMYQAAAAIPWTINLENGSTVYGEAGTGTQNTLSGPVTLSGSTTLNATGVMTISGEVSGVGGSIDKTGGSTLTLSGSNSYDGLTTVTAGVLAVQHPNALGSTAAGTTVISGGQLEVANGVTISGEAVTLNGGGSIFFGALRSGSGNGIWDGQVTLGDSAVRIGALAGTTLTVTGSIVNGGGSSIQISGQSGTGVVILNPTGTNLYSGTTGIVRGILRLGKTDALPTGTVLDVDSASTVSDAATFDLAGFNQTVSALQLSATSNITGLITNSVSGTTSTLTVNQAVNTSFGGVIESGSGTVALVKSGAGNLTLTGSNTYTGLTDIQGGTLSLGRATSTLADTAPVQVSGGTLDVAQSDTVGTVTLLSGTISGANTLTGSSYAVESGVISAKLSGTAVLTKTTGGTVALTGSNSYTGATIISSGTLQIGSGSTTGSLSGSSAITDNAVLVFNRTDTVTQGTNFGTIIGGTGSVIQVGSGSLVLNGSNGFSGGAVVSGIGKIALQNSNGLGSGTLQLNSIRNDTTSSLDLSGSINVANAITIDASTGRNNIYSTSGSNTLSGPITINNNAGFFQLIGNNASDNKLMTVSGNISAATFATNLSFRGTSTGGGLISGTFSAPSTILDFNGATNWTITSTGNNWGATTGILSTGNLILGASNALDSGAKLDHSGAGDLDLNGYNQSIAGLNRSPAVAGAQITNNSATTDSQLTLVGLSADYTYANVIVNGTNGRTVSLVMNSAGRTQILSGSNTYTGLTDVQGGTLSLGRNGGTLADTAPVQVSGGTLDVAQSDTVGAVTLLSGTISGANTLTGSSYAVESGSISAKLAGAGVALTKSTAGTVTLSGSNSYTGLTDVQNGTLEFAVSETLTGGLTVGTSGTAVLTAHTGTVKVLDITGLTISGTAAFAGGGGKDLGGLAVAPVPEPGTIGLLAVGAIGGLLLRRRGRKSGK